MKQRQKPDGLCGALRVFLRQVTKTALSTVFMPITFLAGFWGMNFEDMLGLTSPFGYPIALASMILLVLGLFLFFRQKGWFE